MLRQVRSPPASICVPRSTKRQHGFNILPSEARHRLWRTPISVCGWWVHLPELTVVWQATCGCVRYSEVISADWKRQITIVFGVNSRCLCCESEPTFLAVFRVTTGLHWAKEIDIHHNYTRIHHCSKFRPLTALKDPPSRPERSCRRHLCTPASLLHASPHNCSRLSTER